MATFEPVAATLGGLLVGLVAGLLLLANGRIAGVSGILGGGLRGGRGERVWRLAFLVGLRLGAGLMGLARGGLPVQIAAPPGLLVVAGLLVGFCPGPALAALVTGSGSVLLFVAAMLAGVLLYGRVPSGSVERTGVTT